jgi:hypothetical protein
MKLHHFVVLKLKGIDQQDHLGRVAVDEHDVRLKGVVHQGRHGHRFILSRCDSRDGRFVPFAVLLGLNPHDGPKGAVRVTGGEFRQPQNGGTGGKAEIFNVRSNGPVKVPYQIDHLAHGELWPGRLKKGISCNCSFFSSIFMATGKDLSLNRSSIRRTSFSHLPFCLLIFLTPFSYFGNPPEPRHPPEGPP